MIREVLTATLLVAGSGLMLLAAVGIVRLPDLFTRMHAATKPATLGIGVMMLAVAVHFGELGTTTRALLVVAFSVLTMPVAAHMIGRAAYLLGEPFWEGTTVDEWQRHGRAASAPRPQPARWRRRRRDGTGPPGNGAPARPDEGQAERRSGG